MSKPILTYLEFITPHYKFQLTVRENKYPFHTVSFFAGDEKNPCLEGNIMLENNSKNERYNSHQNKATLLKINALQECSLDDISDEYYQKYSFGTELLHSIVYFINSQFPMIHIIRLNDSSYIPCIRDYSETLDLLTYSIALYKKTWYEEKLNAYILPKEKYDEYRKQVEIYASKETKDSMSFIDIHKMILFSTGFTRAIVEESFDIYKKLFDESETLPDFFKALNKTIKREEKCRFFKTWLEVFINSKISIDRTWYFDLFPKIRKISMLTKKNMTRRKNRS